MGELHVGWSVKKSACLAAIGQYACTTADLLRLQGLRAATNQQTPIALTPAKPNGSHHGSFKPLHSGSVKQRATTRFSIRLHACQVYSCRLKHCNVNRHDILNPSCNLMFVEEAYLSTDPSSSIVIDGVVLQQWE